MRESTVQAVAECHECALSKKPVHSYGSTSLMEVSSRPFDTVFADVLTLPESEPTSTGVVYSKLLIFCCGLTRWVEAVPLPSEPSSEEVIEAFIERIVTRFGVPRALVCDRGSNLISRLCQEVYQLLGIDLKASTAYHHQTAGMVERFNRTLLGLLRATPDGGKRWDLHIPWLCFLMRVTPHEVTKVSPAFLNMGRNLRTPPDTLIYDKLDDADPFKSSQSAEEIHRRLEIAWKAAAEATEAAQLSRKERRDVSRLDPNYEAGDRVLLRRPVGATGVPDGGKLAPIYEGPYRVVEALDNGNFRLRDLPSRHTHDVFHTSRLRPYLTHTNVEAVEEDEYIVKEILSRRNEGADRE